MQITSLSNAFNQVVDGELRWRSFLLIAECARVRHTTARLKKRKDCQKGDKDQREEMFIL